MTEKTTHTPGPWALDAFEDYVEGTDMEVLDADGFPVATVEASPIINRWSERFPGMDHWAAGADDGRTQRERTQEELFANGRVMAAAPDMLDVLFFVHDFIKNMPTTGTDETSRAQIAVRAVIAKASPVEAR